MLDKAISQLLKAMEDCDDPISYSFFLGMLTATKTVDEAIEASDKMTSAEIKGTLEETEEGWPINAFVDFLGRIYDPLETIGEQMPQLQIKNAEDLIGLMRLASSMIGADDRNHPEFMVTLDGIDALKKVIGSK